MRNDTATAVKALRRANRLNRAMRKVRGSDRLLNLSIAYCRANKEYSRAMASYRESV